MVERAILVSDAVAGCCWLHGDYRDWSLEVISKSSASLEVPADYEKEQVKNTEPHFDDGLVSSCFGDAGPPVIPGDCPGFIAFGLEPPGKHPSPSSYAKNGLSQLKTYRNGQ